MRSFKNSILTKLGAALVNNVNLCTGSQEGGSVDHVLEFINILDRTRALGEVGRVDMAYAMKIFICAITHQELLDIREAVVGKGVV